MLTINGKRVAEKVHYCNSIWSQGTGLMLRSKRSVEDTAWVFRFNRPRRVSITMWFVFFPIDILFLDSENTIVDMSSIKPFSLYTPSKKAKVVIELKYGTITAHDIKVGQMVHN